MAHLAETCQSCRLMILSLARPALLERRPAWCETPARHARVDLERLSPRESELLVQTILSSAPQMRRPFGETILAGADGNPFYIEEAIKVLIEKKVIVPTPGRWRIEPNRLAGTPLSPSLSACCGRAWKACPRWSARYCKRRRCRPCLLGQCRRTT